VAVLVLAACGSSGDDAAGSDSTDPLVVDTDAAVTSVAVPTTGPPTTAAASTTITVASTTTALPTTLPETECLDGSWWLSPEETTNLYATLLPGMPVTVTGTHWAEFSGGAVDYWAVLEARFAVGGIDVTFGIDQHGVGTYTVADDVLTMNYDTFESTTHEGHGTAITDPDQRPETYVDEAVDLADNGDGTITINRVTLPVIDIPPVAGGPMGCDGDTMSLGFTSGLADTAAVYVRRS
jgi:hypothetical protein